MAAITSNGTGGGLASVGTSWAGGVVPVAADDVTVAVGDIITLDGTQAWNSLTINGTFAASTTVSSYLTLTGNCIVNNGGVLSFGTDMTPLVTGITTGMDIICATNGQYKIDVDYQGEIYSNSPDMRDPYALLTADTALGSNIINVDRAGSWAIGDRVVFETASVHGPDAAPFSTTIQAISGLQITMAANAPALLDGTTAPLHVANVDNPVNIKSSGAGKLYFHINKNNAAASADVTTLRALTVENSGYNSFRRYGAVNVDGQNSDTGADAAIYGIIFDHIMAFNCFGLIWFNGAGAYMPMVSQVSDKYKNNSFGSHGINTYNLCNMVCGEYFTLHTAYCFRLQLSVSTFDSIKFINIYKPIYAGTGNAAIIKSGLIRHASGWICSIGSLYDRDFYNIEIRDFYQWLYKSDYGKQRFIGCWGDEPTNPLYSSWASGYKNMTVSVLDWQKDPTAQIVYSSRGRIVRDTVTTAGVTPVASIRFEPMSITIPMIYEVNVTVLIGTTLTASVAARRDAGYDGGTLPKITIDGEAVTSAAMTAAANTWETLSVTSPVAAATHTATVRIEIVSSNAGMAWFDDLTIGGTVHDIGQNLFNGGTEVSNVIDITATGVNLTLTGLQAGSDVVILAAGTNTVLASVDQNPTTTYAFSNPTSVSIDIGIIKPGFVTQYIYGYMLDSAAASVPITQLPDRSYV